MKADHARIRELEHWHARRDCEEHGHLYPEDYTLPPGGVEVIERRPFGYKTSIRIINGGPSCTRCGTTLPVETPTH
ncbi:hypothetical protein ACOQFV_08980 [Nocardiopsis changdeensis]|uniref:Uncharacterized protein n=1 Tax=Nocardiopsis changdeensis TaxID=2831969 RepID=A0ABX8BG52_9ACTN|nr:MULTISPECIES: hypothetical protein [Nocardiopsis]QUX20324.1 hypothetical protein KGD84_17500 [Nocardiopsis changdeensis]QYX36254.1 hypothetical protein K1J57_26955 [Nocardiopsis sp. MT53]